MSNILSFPAISPRADAIDALQMAMPELIKLTALDVGAEGVKAFFDGYKDSIDARKLAA